ncbi:Uma2 family endonuclease [Streptomyces sp. Isolate_219]|uniref:Uma2 family endonuclease n=1 Tax=Streptomyces sp. Isolate_219 TaxID=2950110 RepID=UPI0021C61913|nr:Uma2 family endonuclease [Streptomyces sp. Isolate_219]MCR8578670.1 Uma2 family endonuclease [Streptomyces sp. Isolate_219]
MTALVYEAPEATMPRSDRDEYLWQTWKAMELPEGLHAEIIEGSIEVSPTGRYSHGQIANLLRDTLVVFLADSEYVARQDMNVVHERKVWIPDLFITPANADEHMTDDGIGVAASAVPLIVEVVSPGHDDKLRDRVRKRCAYARAGIPVYVIIDDYDDHGHVTVLTSPSPEEANYGDSMRRPYGTDITLPEGPAKGFVIGEAITGRPRSEH